MITRLLLLFFVLAGCTLVRDRRNWREYYFLAEVRPVLQEHCLQCHNGSLPAPSLNLTTKAAAFVRGPGGRDFIVPGDPDRSLLISAVQRKGTHLKVMPRTDLSLTEDQIGTLREWIEDGAFWPEDSRGRLHWKKSAENP